MSSPAVAQTPTTTIAAPTPPPTQFNNVVINTTYIDVVTSYIVSDLFAPPDQRFWPFLLRMQTALAAVGVSVAPASSKHPTLVRPTIATATIAVKPFRSGQVAIPFESFDEYLVTIVHVGTAQHANTVLYAINQLQALAEPLAITRAFAVPDLAAIYSGGGVAVGSGDSQLSIGWHVLLVVGVVLVYGLCIVARIRAQQHQSSEGKDAALTSAAMDNANAHRLRWEPEDLEAKQEELLERTFENDHVRNVRARGGHHNATDIDDAAERLLAGEQREGGTLPAHLKQLAACRRALDEVEENDQLARQAGTLTFEEAAKADIERAGGGRRRDLSAGGGDGGGSSREWSLSRVQDVLELDPAYTLPPIRRDAHGNPIGGDGSQLPTATTSLGRSVGYGGNKRRQRRLANLEAGLENAAAKERREREDAADEAAANNRRRPNRDDDDAVFELPPDAEEEAQRDRDEENAREAVKQKVPLGLQARRIARMMTTMAEDTSSFNPTYGANTVHRSYQLSLDHQSSGLTARRSLRAAQFVALTEKLAADAETTRRQDGGQPPSGGGGAAGASSWLSDGSDASSPSQSPMRSTHQRSNNGATVVAAAAAAPVSVANPSGAATVRTAPSSSASATLVAAPGTTTPTTGRASTVTVANASGSTDPANASTDAAAGRRPMMTEIDLADL